MNSCAQGLALMERLKATRKWAIILGYRVHTYSSPGLYTCRRQTTTT